MLPYAVSGRCPCSYHHQLTHAHAVTHQHMPRPLHGGGGEPLPDSHRILTDSAEMPSLNQNNPAMHHSWKACHTPYSSAWWGCSVDKPPSTASTWPVMKSFSGARKKASADATCAKDKQQSCSEYCCQQVAVMPVLYYCTRECQSQSYLQRGHPVKLTDTISSNASDDSSFRC